MKRILLGLALVFAVGVSAQASVILQQGDSIKFLGQTAGESEGNGGAFSWQAHRNGLVAPVLAHRHGFSNVLH